MGATDKRARKKAHRDEVLAQRTAQLRRRRAVRLVLLVAVLGLIAGLAVATGRDEETEPAASETAAGDGVACGAEAPPAADPPKYDRPPEMDLREGVDYRAVIHTSCGDIEIDLHEDETPITVNNFVFLARDGYFDGLTWHRIERNFVLQTGDPNGQNGEPPDGPGYSIKDELPDRPNEYVYGVVAMANTGQPDTGGSQFFIIVHEGADTARDPKQEPAGLQALYSIFGTVDPASYETLDALARLETKGGNDPVEAVKPVTPAYIESIEIIET